MGLSHGEAMFWTLSAGIWLWTYVTQGLFTSVAADVCVPRLQVSWIEPHCTLSPPSFVVLNFIWNVRSEISSSSVGSLWCSTVLLNFAILFTFLLKCL